MDAHIVSSCAMCEWERGFVDVYVYMCKLDLKFYDTSCHKIFSPTCCRTVSPTYDRIKDNHIQTQTHINPPNTTLLVDWTTHVHPLTGPGLDASLGARHGEDGEAVIVLGAAGLYGADVAVTAGAKHTWKIQGLDSLRLHLPKHGLTHCLKLTIQRISQLSGENNLWLMQSSNSTVIYIYFIYSNTLLPVSLSESECNCESACEFWVWFCC